MAIKPEIWNEARIMFEGGKSLNEISATTGIHKGNISKKSNSEGWIKGKLQPLINDSVRVATEKATLSNPEVAFVNNEIAEKTKHLQFIHNATLKNLSVQMKKVNDNTTHQEHKFVQESINKGGEATVRVKEVKDGKDTGEFIEKAISQLNPDDIKLLLITPLLSG